MVTGPFGANVDRLVCRDVVQRNAGSLASRGGGAVAVRKVVLARGGVEIYDLARSDGGAGNAARNSRSASRRPHWPQ
jgi:hypothetical protein